MVSNNLVGGWVRGCTGQTCTMEKKGEKGVETVCGCSKRANVGTRRVKQL